MDLTVLTTVNKVRAPAEAKYLLARAEQEATSEASGFIIEMVTTIVLYKFKRLSRAEVEAMLDIRLQETRVYQEAKEEGRIEGEQLGRQNEAIALVLKQLTRKLGQELPEEIQSQIVSFPLPCLEDLGEALLGFSTIADLEIWLAAQSQGDRESH